jgi:ATP-binding cassette subfamily C protein CydD
MSTKGRPFDPRLLEHARGARGYLVLTVGLGLATTALVLAQAGLLAHVLATAARGSGLRALAGTLVALLCVLLGRAAASYGSESAAMRAAAIVKSRLRRRLAERALTLGPSWLAGQQAGEITALATRGLDALDSYFARYVPQVLLAVLVPIAVLARVTAADWVSGLIIGLTLPLIPLFAALVGTYSRDRTRRQWQLLAGLAGHFLDVVEGLPTLKVFGRARAQAEIIRTVSGQHRSATMTTLRIAFLSALVLELAAALATALVAVEVGLRLLAGHIGYETALLVLLLTPEAYLPLRNAGAQFHASVEGTVAAGRVFEILDVKPPVPGPDRARPARRRQTAAAPDLRSEPVILTNVTLAYPSRATPALTGFSITISPGDRILLTGPSGAGKSSLLGLLLRFAEPTSGGITVGDADLAAIPVTRWRRQLAWVPQRPYLFAGSVADNIALGAPAATPAAIREAARLAGADDFVMALPFGYDTMLSECGLTVSAGQRQRLALARAFLRDAPLVLLDEPTAHLDAVSSRQILTAIASLAAGRTVLLASHGEHATIGVTRTIELDHGQLKSEAPAPPPSPPLPSGNALPARTGDPAGLATGR